MGQREEMIEQLESKSDSRRLEAIDYVKEFEDVEALPVLLRLMLDPAETVWTDLSKHRHPKIEAYRAAKVIATEGLLLKSLIDRKFPETRAGAAYMLGEFSTPESAETIQALRNALQDPDPRVPYQAMRSLSRLNALTIKELLPFYEANSPLITQYATQALGVMPGEQATEVLSFLAANEQASVAIRALAIRYLGEREAQNASSQLTDLLLDAEPVLRQHAALALGRMGAFASVKSLYQTLIDDDEDVRYAVGVALGLLGDVRTVPFLLKAKHYADEYTQQMVDLAFERLGENALAELLTAMRKLPLPYRVDAVERLDTLRDERVLLPFIQYLMDAQVYAPIRSALLNLGEQIEAPLIYVLEREDANVELKEKAIRLLLDRNCAAAVPALIALLEHDSVTIRELSARSLGKLQANDAESALLKVIAKKDRESDDVIAEALLSLGRIGKISKKGRQVLQDHLDHLNSKVRGYSISALGEVGDNSMVDSLIERMMDPQQDNRPLMIQAVAKLGDKKAAEPLLTIVAEAQRNAVSGLRGAYLGSYAVQALAKLGEVRVIDLLLTDWEEELEQGILQMGGVAIPHLEKALQFSKQNRVRQLAAEGLALVANTSSMGVLISALQDDDPAVVQAAAKALKQIHSVPTTPLLTVEESN